MILFIGRCLKTIECFKKNSGSSYHMASTLHRYPKGPWNLVLVGDRSVGKTAFAHQETYDSSTEDEHRRVIQIDGMMTEFRIVDSRAYRECCEELPHIIRSGHAFILMYSTTQRITFEDIVGYCSQVRRIKHDPDTLFVIVGNKCDLVHKREVTHREGAALADELGCNFFETSSKTGENVQPVVVTLARLLKDKDKDKRRGKFWNYFGRWWTLLCC
ncbi:P-loop containing nucleoside triphosphate hydrolase protein [Collybia nuda]|uniref:small monomeric GTPase n=1 Tax=Collybia nuda TaxID=64659 RepID=A0A9P5YHM4_9AGAR|nr:P-loop containing nucleoside triphosphate hydrolase protein [Collybia nuda]